MAEHNDKLPCGEDSVTCFDPICTCCDPYYWHKQIEAKQPELCNKLIKTLTNKEYDDFMSSVREVVRESLRERGELNAINKILV